MKVWLCEGEHYGQYDPMAVRPEDEGIFAPNEYVDVDDEVWDTYVDAKRLHETLLRVILDKARDEGKIR